MPSVIAFELDVPGPVDPYPARLHGAACALLERPDGDHGAQDKPFAVWPLMAGEDPTGARWRLGWLADRPPALPTTPALSFGPARCRVRARDVTEVSFAQLAVTAGIGLAQLELVSPTFFSRNGRDLPLPDPVLIIDSALRRWNLYAPSGLDIAEDERRALRGAVVLTDLDGRTERGAVSYTMAQTGFVGTVTLGLPRKAEQPLRCLFGALMRFVEVAGVGAQTTHGFGAARLLRTG